MSLEPVQSNPCEVESKGGRGWIFMLPFGGDVAQLWQAAVLGLIPYRPRVKLWFFQDRALNFAGFARVHMLWSSWLPEERVCHVIDEFHSLQRAQCPFDEKFLNSFQGQAEETLMLQALCHLVVNVLRPRSEQSV
eukprot:s1150_g12.t1